MEPTWTSGVVDILGSIKLGACHTPTEDRIVNHYLISERADSSASNS